MNKKDYYVLAPTMYGRDTYPEKGKIHLNENTSQKDLKYLLEEAGMTKFITKSELTEAQIEVIEKKREARLKGLPKEETKKPVAKKKKGAVDAKKDEEVDE